MVNTEKEKHYEITKMDHKSIHSTVLPRPARRIYCKQTPNDHSRSGTLASCIRPKSERVFTMKKFLTAVWNFFEAWGEYRYQIHKRRGFVTY